MQEKYISFFSHKYAKLFSFHLLHKTLLWKCKLETKLRRVLKRNVCLLVSKFFAITQLLKLLPLSKRNMWRKETFSRGSSDTCQEKFHQLRQFYGGKTFLLGGMIYSLESWLNKRSCCMHDF